MTDKTIPGIRACVFDAYGTLFDVNSSARAEQQRLGATWKPLADLWRSKQLQYTWLRGLGGRHADFWQVTGDALDFAMESLGLEDAALRRRLMDLYLSLECYADVPQVLRELRGVGMGTAILSNGTPAMLESAVRHAGLDGLFDHVISIEEVGVYKPHPSVYRLASERFAVASGQLAFVSSNAWDACAAQGNGLRAVWCNRTGQRPERLPEAPERKIDSLAQLPALVIPGMPTGAGAA